MKEKKKNKNSSFKFEIIVILDNLRSAYNVGSVFRTAEAIKVQKIYLVGITPDPINNQKIKKVALGAEDYILWEKVEYLKPLLKKLKKEKYFLIGLEQTKYSKNIFQINLLEKIKKKKKKKIALLLGQEIKGLSLKILKDLDLILEIPMFGRKESLNVAVAFGIAVYQIRKLLKEL
jgi:tRNA G18 (ribose-2'-O)-methylase SpoU